MRSITSGMHPTPVTGLHDGELDGIPTKEFIRQLVQNLVEWTRRIGRTQGN